MAREENGVFPGDWESLKGKAVKLYTVQPVSADPKETNAHAKLAFAAAQMRKFISEPVSSASGPEGVVVVFDSADGGIAAATTALIQELAGGSLREDAFWKRAYLDPPETFQTKK